MSTSHLSISPQQLKQANDLTRLSIHPGGLDYSAYRHYLIALGHLRSNHYAAPPNAPTVPQNTLLQLPASDRTDNRTDFRADQALWSQDFLPELMYALDKPTDWLEKHHLKEPPPKPYNIYNACLRDVPILPDHISAKIEGWRIEAWIRFDPRVSLTDIIQRMEPARRPKSKSVIQMRTLRFREDCKILGWVAMGKNYEARKLDLVREMAGRGMDPRLNSTRGISWGLVDKTLGEAGGRVIIPENRRLDDTVDMNDASVQSMNSVITTPGYCSVPSTPDSELTTLAPSEDMDENYGTFNKDEDAEEKNEDNDDDDEKKVADDDDSHEDGEDDTNYTGLHFANARTSPMPTLFSPIRPTTTGCPTRNNNHNPDDIHTHHPTLSYTRTDVPILPGTPTTTTTTTTTITYLSRPLTLKTPHERHRDRQHGFLTPLLRQWHPTGSEGRRLQLAYLLDPVKLARGRGFVDNRGFWPPVGCTREGDELEAECIEADIVYG